MNGDQVVATAASA